MSLYETVRGELRCPLNELPSRLDDIEKGRDTLTKEKILQRGEKLEWMVRSMSEMTSEAKIQRWQDEYTVVLDLALLRKKVLLNDERTKAYAAAEGCQIWSDDRETFIYRLCMVVDLSGLTEKKLMITFGDSNGEELFMRISSELKRHNTLAYRFFELAAEYGMLFEDDTLIEGGGARTMFVYVEGNGRNRFEIKLDIDEFLPLNTLYIHSVVSMKDKEAYLLKTNELNRKTPGTSFYVDFRDGNIGVISQYYRSDDEEEIMARIEDTMVLCMTELSSITERQYEKFLRNKKLREKYRLSQY